jgi:uncharacterized protein
MRIAVVGSGISGISAAWLLSPANQVDLFESEQDLGGHTRTIDVDCGAGPFPVDTGFQVFNRRTYPNLTRFFETLGIDATDADMSFSVQVRDADIEWSGTNLDTVFAQRKNVTNPRFLRMLTDVLRLSREADRLLADPTIAELTLGELMKREGYSEAFTDWYLIPMGDAIWSTPPGSMLDYPALTFLRFCDNHGLLHILGKPLWLSVPGGARRYIKAALQSLSGELFSGEPVERVERTGTGVRVSTPARTRDYDAIVFASHPPQTLAALGGTASAREREVLSAFVYWDNDVIVHTDESFLPRERRAWASWNWYSETSEMSKAALVLTYRINTLQQLPTDAPTVMETLNCDRRPVEGSVLAELSFQHPMYSRDAVAAQAALPSIQGVDRVWYAGAWTRYGFHEDGLLSGVRVAEALGAVVPWGAELDASRTRVRLGVREPMLGQTRSLLPGEHPPVAEPDATPRPGAGSVALDM